MKLHEVSRDVFTDGPFNFAVFLCTMTSDMFTSRLCAKTSQATENISVTKPPTAKLYKAKLKKKTKKQLNQRRDETRNTGTVTSEGLRQVDCCTPSSCQQLQPPANHCL